MTLNVDPRDYDFEPWDDTFEDDQPRLLDRLSGNTGMIAGVLTVIVTFSVVSANALFYQPHPHQGALFSTRDTSVQPVAQDQQELAQKPITSSNKGQSLAEDIAKLPEIAPEPQARIEKTVIADPQKTRVRFVQTVLKDLAIYSDKVDGVSGPKTRAAIKAYQKIVGLEQSGKIDRQLLAQLAGNDASVPTNAIIQTDDDITVASIKPTPRPEKKPQIIDDVASLIEGQNTANGSQSSKDRVKQLQAGLRQFDNPDIVVDGVQGPKTTAALKLFQETFHLKVTGKADDAVFAKMRDLGYIN